MQFLIIIALLVSLLAWLANIYHRLSQLRDLTARAWRRCRSVVKERNAALRELSYLLSLQEGAPDLTLQELRRTEGDLSINLVHSDFLLMHDNELRLQQLLLSLSADLQQASHEVLPSPLQQAYHLVMMYDAERRDCFARYNECALRYNKVLSLSVNRVVGGIFHFIPQDVLPVES